MSFASSASASASASAVRARGRGRARGVARGDSAVSRASGKSVARASRKSVAEVSSDADVSEKTVKRSPSTMVTSVVEEEEDGLEHVYEKARWLDARAEFRPTHGGRDRHFCIGVERLEPLTEALEREGIAYTASKSGRPAIFFRDPDCNTLEVVEGLAWRGAGAREAARGCGEPSRK